MPEEDRTLILAASEVVLYGGRGSLQQQLVSGPEPVQPPAFVPPEQSREEPSQPLPFLELPYFNGLGGFTPGRARVRDLSRDRTATHLRRGPT